MCGIGGLVPADRVVNLAHVKRLWRALQDRGTHASGMAFMRAGESQAKTVKGPVKSATIIDRGVVARMGSAVDWLLLHTRFTTQGSTKNNDNNHPVCRDGIILTHNGVISNDQEMFDDMALYGVTRRFDVDTEALAAGLAHMGLEWVADRANGSMSIAWVDTKDNPDRVNWFTNGLNPLVIGRLDDDSIVWASQPHHLEGLPVRDWFWAQPWKHYWTGGDGRIHSKWVSDRRDPACTWQYEHAATRANKRTTRARAQPAREAPIKSHVTPARERTDVDGDIVGGWVYDAKDNGWRKAKESDYQQVLFDEDGNLV